MTTSVYGDIRMFRYYSENHARREMLSYFKGYESDVICADITPVMEWIRDMGLSDPQRMIEQVDILRYKTSLRPPAETCLLGCIAKTDDGYGLALAKIRSQHFPHIQLLQAVPGDADDIATGGEKILVTTAEGLFQSTYRGQSCDTDIDPNFVTVLLCGLAMFHIRNIGTRDVPFPRNVRRAAKKASDGSERGPTVYRTLTLRPFADDEEQNGGGMSTGEVPLHLVRGHFATYSPERKLFGKYVGTFWRPEHFAGSPSVAVVKKTYVMQPNEAAC